MVSLDISKLSPTSRRKAKENNMEIWQISKMTSHCWSNFLLIRDMQTDIWNENTNKTNTNQMWTPNMAVMNFWVEEGLCLIRRHTPCWYRKLNSANQHKRAQIVYMKREKQKHLKEEVSAQQNLETALMNRASRIHKCPRRDIGPPSIIIPGMQMAELQDQYRRWTWYRKLMFQNPIYHKQSRIIRTSRFPVSTIFLNVQDHHFCSNPETEAFNFLIITPTIAREYKNKDWYCSQIWTKEAAD